MKTTYQRQPAAQDRLLTVTETASATAAVTLTYNALGWLMTETSHGLLHTYHYDLTGSRLRADYGTGRRVTTSYDALKRPVIITDDAGSPAVTRDDLITTYGYDLAGRAVRLRQPNGNLCWNVYDVLGRLKERTLYLNDSLQTQHTAMLWDYDAIGGVLSHHENWPGSAQRPQGWRITTLTYDDANRLFTEVVSQSGSQLTHTTYTYDDSNNRATKTVLGGDEPGYWTYHYNSANQLRAWNQFDEQGGVLVKSADILYDAEGNRSSQEVSEPGEPLKTTTYGWDIQNRLSSVQMPDGSTHSYQYDYRVRRIRTQEVRGTSTKSTAIVFSGGLSLAEWEQSGPGLQPVVSGAPMVEYTRGPDMGGGVGGLLYTARMESGTGLQPVSLKYNLSNGRGDIVAQSDSAGALTWTASYEAYGKRTKETGSNADKQRANSKDEDPTGLLNEGFRYRDIETGVWLSRDPAGFVDGPNLYAYVAQNPWTSWDPLGLWGYDDTLRWGAEQASEGNNVAAYGAAFVATAWDAFSFGSASKNDAAALSYSSGEISGKQLAGEMAVNTITSSAKAVAVYGTGGLASAGTSVGGAMAVGAGTGAAVGTLEVANNRANAAIENRAYEGTAGSDVRDVAVSAGFGAATAGAFQLGANTLQAGMQGYAQASIPKYNGSQTEGALVTNNLDFVRLQSGGANPQFSNYPAASHVEGKAALFMRDGGATSGTVFHNNPGGTCGMCNSNIPTFLPKGSTLTTVPPAGAAATKRGFNASEKTYTGNSADPKPRK